MQRQRHVVVVVPCCCCCRCYSCCCRRCCCRQAKFTKKFQLKCNNAALHHRRRLADKPRAHSTTLSPSPSSSLSIHLFPSCWTRCYKQSTFEPTATAAAATAATKIAHCNCKLTTRCQAARVAAKVVLELYLVSVSIVLLLEQLWQFIKLPSLRSLLLLVSFLG